MFMLQQSSFSFFRTLYIFTHVLQFVPMQIIVFLIQRQEYFRFSSVLEWALHILAILLVLPLGDAEYIDNVALRLVSPMTLGS